MSAAICCAAPPEVWAGPPQQTSWSDEIGHAGFRHRRDVRHLRGALLVEHRQHLDLAVAIERQSTRNVAEEQVDVAAQHVLQHQRFAAVGHMDHLVPVMVMNRLAVRCGVAPLPWLPNTTLPGLFLMYSTSSFSELTGNSFFTMVTLGTLPSTVIGTKSSGL